VALVVRFLLTSGLPPLLGGAPDESSELLLEPDADMVAAAIADPALQAAVRAQLEDAESRAEFERVLRGVGPNELSALLSGSGPPLTLDDISVVPGGEVVLGGGGVEDAYRTAAREMLESDPSLTTVIMGHTHGPIDGYTEPIELANGQQGFYFNSGTWTRHLREDGQRSYSWVELADEENYTTLFTYLRLDPDGAGGYRPALASWYEEDAPSQP
jgi:hypothetical protein